MNYIWSQGKAQHAGFVVNQCIFPPQSIFSSTKSCQCKFCMKWQALYTVTQIWDMETLSVFSVWDPNLSCNFPCLCTWMYSLGPLFHIKHKLRKYLFPVPKFTTTGFFPYLTKKAISLPTHFSINQLPLPFHYATHFKSLFCLHTFLIGRYFLTQFCVQWFSCSYDNNFSFPTESFSALPLKT